MIQAGAAVIDITPPAGLAMSGFAARTETALSAHDPLTARAVVVGDTAIVVADVIGFHADMSARIRARCRLPADNVVVVALHNHGGPVSMDGRLCMEADVAYLRRLEDGCVAAIDQAAARRRPARLSAGTGDDPDIARNRRHAGGIVDRALPVLRIDSADGEPIAMMISYACHPVVLGADNRFWTADYPHFVRRAVEQANSGAVALVMTGCCGDANTGHAAHASVSLAANAARTFAEAERIGNRVAAYALKAEMMLLETYARVANVSVTLRQQPIDNETPKALLGRWRKEQDLAEPARAALLRYWMHWAAEIAGKPPTPFDARVTALDWGGVPIVALPGEIFAETALAIRRARNDGERIFVIGFCEDNPGYIPPTAEFAFGGYEVEEAHRYYGQAAPFAPGSAEALGEAASKLLATGV